MLYCKILNNEIISGPRYLPQEIPESTAVENNWYPVVFLNLPHHIEPDCNPVTQLIDMHMEIDGNIVKIKHIIIDKSSDQIEATKATLMNKIRETRNQKLLFSDWTQLPTSPLTLFKKQEWEAYRQLLRDFPANVTLENIIWPTEPTKE